MSHRQTPRPRLRFIPLAAAGAAALACPGTGQAQPSQSQISAIRGACRSDYMQVCASVPTGGAAALTLSQAPGRMSSRLDSAEVDALAAIGMAPQQVANLLTAAQQGMAGSEMQRQQAREARRRQVEDVLQHLVDQGAAERVGRGRLGQPVDRAEPEQQGTAEEVGGPAGGERPEHVNAVDPGATGSRRG